MLTQQNEGVSSFHVCNVTNGVKADKHLQKIGR